MNKIKQIFGGDARQLGMIFALVALIVLFQILTGGSDAAARQRQQHHPGQRLHPGPRHRHGAGDHRRPHRPVGRFGRGVRRHRRRHRHARLGRAVVAAASSSASPSAPSSVRWQGFWVAYVGIPAFIVTLAGMLFFRGAEPVRRQVQHRPGAARVPGDRRRARCPRSARAPGYNNLTVLLGLARLRRDHLRHPAQPPRSWSRSAPTVEEAWVTYTRMTLICVVVLGAMLLIASGRKGFPIPGSSSSRWSCSTGSSPARRSSAGTSTRSAATGTPPSCPACAASGSTSWSWPTCRSSPPSPA